MVHTVTASIPYGCSLHFLRLQVCAAWSQPVQLYCAACVVDAYGTVVPEAAEVRTQSIECQPGQEALSWGRVELALRLPRRAIAAPGAALQLSIVEEASGMVRSEYCPYY